MDVQRISNTVRMQKWMSIIEECSKSEMPVKTWCNENNISEQSYYYWLKKIRTKAVHEITQHKVSFSPLPIQEIVKPKSTIMISITKEDIHTEVPDTIDQSVLMNIMRTLLC